MLHTRLGVAHVTGHPRNAPGMLRTASHRLRNNGAGFASQLRMLLGFYRTQKHEAAAKRVALSPAGAHSLALGCCPGSGERKRTHANFLNLDLLRTRAKPVWFAPFPRTQKLDISTRNLIHRYVCRIAVHALPAELVQP
jgi:hypothetical protein